VISVPFWPFSKLFFHLVFSVLLRVLPFAPTISMVTLSSVPAPFNFAVVISTWYDFISVPGAPIS